MEHNINVVPVPPCSSISDSLGFEYERTQFPLRLAWSVTIHKSQGLTHEQIWVDLGKSEISQGLSYVALSRARNLQIIIVEPLSFERLDYLKIKPCVNTRINEENRLYTLSLKSVSFHLILLIY